MTKGLTGFRFDSGTANVMLCSARYFTEADQQYLVHPALRTSLQTEAKNESSCVAAWLKFDDIRTHSWVQCRCIILRNKCKRINGTCL